MTRAPSKYLIFVGVFFTSLSSIFIRFSEAPSLVISAYRMLFTVLFLLIPVILKDFKNLAKIKTKELFLCILSGIFLALHFATWIASIKITTIASSTVLVSLNPVFVAIASFFLFNERLSKKSIIGIIIAIAGSIVIAFADIHSGSSHAFKGDLLAFLGSIFVAGYFIIGKIVRKNLSNGSYVFIVYSVSALVLFSLCYVTKTPVYPYSMKEFAIFISLAFFCSILGHTVYNWLMQYIPATFVSTSTLIEPIFASFMAFILFKEAPSILTLLGGLIIIIGIYWFIRNQRAKKSI